MIDYEVLRFIWWLLVGVLLIGFAVTDGFDMGVGMLTRFLGRNDTERRIMINSIAPHWDGNQVWLITAGGALFAAWPMVYAAAFSGFYVAMILVLASLFFRPVGFDYRSKIEETRAERNKLAVTLPTSLIKQYGNMIKHKSNQAVAYNARDH